MILTDALFLALAFRLAYWVRFDVRFTLAPEVTPNPEFYPSLDALLILISVLVFFQFKLYDSHLLLGGVSEYSRVFNACSAATMMVILATFFVPEFVVSRMWVVSSWLFSLVLVVSNRFLCRRLAYALRRYGYLLTPAAVVGTNEEAVTLAGNLSHWQSSGLRIMGFVSTDSGRHGQTPKDCRASARPTRSRGLEPASSAPTFEKPLLYADVNVVGSVNVLESCRGFGVKKMIYASTGGAVYGEF